MAPRRVQVNKFDYKKITANDVVCPICRSILIKPVTLPCSHGFCASCFETTTQNANLVCPLCRVRVGSWLRTATKSKKLINETLWQVIQDRFPIQVRNKLNRLEGKFAEEKKTVRQKVENTVKTDANLIRSKKRNDKLNSVPSTSAATLTKVSGLVNTISRNLNQNNSVDLSKNVKAANAFLNNFASKEYTCRILCQNLDSKETQKFVPNESLTLIQRKNKRIQKITESESLNDRSNSIESECLYFKPIDYKHNPPSEGLAPIKVPTKKPNVNANAKILAPCGQNQINMNHLESAFARLFSPTLSEEKAESSNIKSGVDQESSKNSTAGPVKRKNEKSESKSRKKMKNNDKRNECPVNSNKKNIGDKLPSLCDNGGSYGVENANITNNANNVKKSTKNKHLTNKLFSEEDIKRSLQEKADFELATKLQQTYNQTTKYSTRSSVLKRMAGTKQIKIDGIMPPFEVK